MTYMNNPNRIMSEPGKNLYEQNHGLHCPAPCQKEYSRLLTAAVVNERFRNLLLADPDSALRVGYCGETFHFSPEEHQRVISIRAASLSEFARQLMENRSSVYQYLNY